MLRFHLLLVSALGLTSLLQPTFVPETTVVTPKEDLATLADFPGGPAALSAYLAAVPYPEAARASQAEGRVFVHFEISPEGKVEKVAAVLPLTEEERRKAKSRAQPAALPAPNPLLVKAAEQLVAAMPTWKPATAKGKPVVSMMTVPVDFRSAPAAASAPVYAYADQMPVFVGSSDKYPLLSLIQRAASYPPEALRNGAQGTVLVYFTVNEKGQVEQAEIIRSVYPAIDNSVLRAVQAQRATTPALHQGKPVKVFYTLPVTFAIR